MVSNLLLESKFNIQTYQCNTNCTFDRVASKMNLNLITSSYLTSDTVYSSNLELDIQLCLLFYMFIFRNRSLQSVKIQQINIISANF